MTQSKPEMWRHLLGLLGKRCSALSSGVDVRPELPLLFCYHHVRTYLRMESALREMEPGDEVQESRTRAPFCTLDPLDPLGFPTTEGINFLFVDVRIFATESVLNDTAPFTAQRSPSSFPFFAMSKTSHGLDPAQMLPHPINKLCFPELDLSPLEFPEHFTS